MNIKFQWTKIYWEFSICWVFVKIFSHQIKVKTRWDTSVPINTIQTSGKYSSFWMGYKLKIWNELKYKTVLHERKRHTACRIASTLSAVLSWRGVPHPWQGGTQSLSGGAPYWGTPVLIWLGGGTPYLGSTSSWGTPILTWPGETPCLAKGVPLSWCTPHLGLGHPPVRNLGPVTGYPQKGPDTSRSIMGWIWGTPPRVWTDRCLWKQYLPVVLCTRAVKFLCHWSDRGAKKKTERCGNC